MLFNQLSFASVILLAIIIWLTALSALVLRSLYHYNRLTQGIVRPELKDILERLLENQVRSQKEIAEINRILKTFETQNKFHIQRIGLVRFNPFSDTGGTQSFTLALLDGLSNGIVMTSLYARSGNRWYTKEILEGKGKDIELSKEEAIAIRKASVSGGMHL